jgi:predicted O-methyltransferase YrrM
MRRQKATKTWLEPDRPGLLTVLWIRVIGVFRLLSRGRFHQLMGHLGNFVYRRKSPGDPWLSRPANLILDSFLRKDDVGLEFGSGKSTVWFAERVSGITSIEHDSTWHDKVTKELAMRNLRNVDCLLVERDVEDEKGQDAAYVRITDKFAKNSFDFILVDGAYRDNCALASLELLRPGGILIIDDAHWFLPSSSTSPKARTYAQGPASAKWEQFMNAVINWRCIRTTDGIHDTLLYLKPCED